MIGLKKQRTYEAGYSSEGAIGSSYALGLARGEVSPEGKR